MPSNKKKDRKPGDLIIDRYLPDASPEDRERAREALRRYALILRDIGKDMKERGYDIDADGKLVEPPSKEPT